MSLKNTKSISQQDTRVSVNTANISSILNTLRAGAIPSISDTKWKDVLTEQDHDNYIFGLREELLSRVFDEINTKFLEHQQVKYVVQCAYESWKRILCLNFYFHEPCDGFYQKVSSWPADMEPDICKPDSWSRGFVGMKKSEAQIQVPDKADTVLSDYQLIKLTDYPSDNYFDHNSPTVIKPIKKEDSILEIYSTSTTNVKPSIENYPFTVTSPASSGASDADQNMIINKISSDSHIPVRPSELHFYKRVKRRERFSIDADANNKLKILHSRNLPTWSPVEEVRKVTLPPLRYFFNINHTHLHRNLFSNGRYTRKLYSV